MITTKTMDKSSDKRKAILDASLKLFCNKCFQDTSTASISQQANVATGTLFLYFESKEALVNELYLECKEDYASYLEKDISELRSFKTKLKHIWEKGLEWRINNPDKLKFMMQFCSSPYITKHTKEKALTRLQLLNQVVKDGMISKEISASDAELLSAMLAGYFHTAALFLMENSSHKNFNKWKEEAFDYIWRGIH
ncbi:MAG: Transcriptional regulator, TetR family [Bacteroidota bacterium]|nr:Transcriptional regulator, TetR family [Bacteroidota bacterium]